jgi:hypothetical protein
MLSNRLILFKRFVFRNIYWLQLVLVQSVLILLGLMHLTDEEISKLYYNNDYLYLATLYTDIFIDGNNLGTWSLTPNPYFFPDMPVYFITYALAGSAGPTMLIFALIQLLFVEFCFFKILQLLLNDHQKARIYLVWSTLFLQLFLMAGAFGKEAFIGHLLLTNSSHVGMVICGLLAFYLFLSYWKHKKISWLIGLFVLILSSILSDRMFLVQTLPPLLLGSMLILFKHKDLRPLLITITAVGIGWLGLKYLTHTLHLLPKMPQPPLTTRQSLHNFIETFRFIREHYPVGRLILYLHLGLLVFSPLGFIWFKKQSRVGYLLLWVSAVLSFTFPIYYGFFQAIDTFRYILQSYIFILLLAPLIIMGLLKFPSIKKFTVGFSVLFAGYVAFVAYHELDKKKLGHFISFKNEHVQLVENNQARLKNGIADYWHAKDVYLLGGQRNRVVSVRPDFEAHVWQENRSWYFGKKNDSPPVFNFTINLRPDSLLGSPLDSIPGSDNTLFIYPDFSFKKDARNRTTLYLLNPK